MEGEAPAAGATDLRNLLAVAVALRRLAVDASIEEASLYLAAAGSLARKAARLAGILPEQTPPAGDMRERTGLHRPVDIRV